MAKNAWPREATFKLKVIQGHLALNISSYIWRDNDFKQYIEHSTTQ